MIESFAFLAADRWQRSFGRSSARVGLRLLTESVYLSIAPVIVAAGLAVTLGGLCVRLVSSMVPGRSPAAARVLPLAQWQDAAYGLVQFPVAGITSAATALWWFCGLAAGTSALRDGELNGRTAFGTGLGLTLLLTLPLMTRACLAVQTGLSRALPSDASALHRRIIGFVCEREAAPAPTAEATALRRLERDIHDGPQQRLVRLALELGRAQHHFDTRPDAVRDALAEAIAQTQEALGELRALSHGIAPPILVDRGLGEALKALAARSAMPVELDADLDPHPGRRLDAAVETAAYFVVAEALTNVAKHSYGRRCAIGLRHGEGTLRIWVTDDGIGGAALDKGHGLRGLDDRVHSIGGRLQVTSPGGGPTTVTAELPCC